jgi:hypothetical protein
MAATFPSQEFPMTDPIVPEPTPYAPTPSAANPTPVLSIISMIVGILGFLIGFFGLGLLFAIGAVVLGHLGKRKEPGAKGFWLTGLITGYVGILINVIVIAFWIIATIALVNSGNSYYQ